MPTLDIDSLLAPLGGDSPCGADLEYDPVFHALQEAAAGKPERQYGATVIPAESADWPAVLLHAAALAARTRDLRVAVWLTRAGARTDGFMAAAEGIRLLRGLIESQWEHVHPAIDPADANDATARLNAMAPLWHEEGLADLRAAGLTTKRGAITVRSLELALGHVEPRAGEASPTVGGIAPAVALAQSEVPGLAPAMPQALADEQAIDAALKRYLGEAQAPDFSPLTKLLRSVALAGTNALELGHAAPGGTANEDASSMGNNATAIRSRDDAIRTLQRVCDWFESNEPSHPAPLLIQRAQRLIKKNFMEIIRDLVPDGLGQVEKLAGTVRD